jgi:hypothetical protein
MFRWSADIRKDWRVLVTQLFTQQRVYMSQYAGGVAEYFRNFLEGIDPFGVKTHGTNCKRLVVA